MHTYVQNRVASTMIAKSEDEANPLIQSQTEADPWHTLVRFHDLPKWQQDNHYILSGYRKASHSYLRSIQSMLHWHNESINIWTHFLPGVLLVPLGGLLYNTLKPRYEMASSADVYAMSCFFVCAASGMMMSGIFHTLSNHSPTIAKFWNQLDYVGISLMIWGSFVPSVFYGFWCDAGLRKTYWSMVCMSQPPTEPDLICHRSPPLDLAA